MILEQSLKKTGPTYPSPRGTLELTSTVLTIIIWWWNSKKAAQFTLSVAPIGTNMRGNQRQRNINTYRLHKHSNAWQEEVNLVIDAASTLRYGITHITRVVRIDYWEKNASVTRWEAYERKKVPLQNPWLRCPQKLPPFLMMPLVTTFLPSYATPRSGQLACPYKWSPPIKQLTYGSNA